MKKTLIIISCVHKSVMSHLAKRKLNQTTKLKGLEYDLMLNPSIEAIDLLILRYDSIFLISYENFLERYPNVFHIDMKSFLNNPNDY